MESVCDSLHTVRDACNGNRLEQCLVTRADLSVLSFEEYVLDRVKFQSVSLGGVNFLKSMLYSVSFNGAQLRETPHVAVAH